MKLTRRHQENVLRYIELPQGGRITWHIRAQGLADMPHWFRRTLDDERFNEENELECVAHPEDQGFLVSITKPAKQSVWLHTLADYMNRQGHIKEIK